MTTYPEVVMGGTSNSQSRHRRSVRLIDYDYAAEGVYFVTICTWSKRMLLAASDGPIIALNAVGTMVEQEWLRTDELRDGVNLDAFVVMPNHLHGLVVIGDCLGKPIEDIAGDGYFVEKAVTKEPRSEAGTLGAVVRGFKASTTRQARTISGCDVRLWQRGFYEHVVRDAGELRAIREYIVNNPKRWAEDRENPACDVPGIRDGFRVGKR
jgi:putative transposase